MSPSKISKSSNFNSAGKSNMKNDYDNSNASVDTFSHTLKHPYLALSPDCHTVTKSSHPGNNKFYLRS